MTPRPKCEVCGRPLDADEYDICRACWWSEKTFSESE